MSNEILKKSLLDRTVNLLRKNIKTIFVLLAVTFILLFSILFYNYVESKNNIKTAEQYSQALILIKQKKINESKKILENIINEDHKFYSPLALYIIIQNNIEPNTKKVINFFDKILKINSIDKENLNLIKIKKSIYLINLDKEELVIETLNPIINSESVWRVLAINLISEYFLSKNQTTKAKEYILLLKEKKN
jgi:predicted negative regulator of RcsB-dependent stress response|tara:strand:- start:6707 stop:7285 length:579 start_codon:yes stop_codon:yes gene_type:complete